MTFERFNKLQMGENVIVKKTGREVQIEAFDEECYYVYAEGEWFDFLDLDAANYEV